MTKIGLFYGSGTGKTFRVAQIIKGELEKDAEVDLRDIGKSFADDVRAYDKLIFGTSTWYQGDLEDDWESFFPDLETIDFQGKTVALFGLGNQVEYPDTFMDALGTLYLRVKERGATVIGSWPTEGYSFSHSKAVEGGRFVGLALDEDNQAHLTESRVKKWVAELKEQLLK